MAADYDEIGSFIYNERYKIQPNTVKKVRIKRD